MSRRYLTLQEAESSLNRGKDVEIFLVHLPIILSNVFVGHPFQKEHQALMAAYGKPSIKDPQII